MIMNEGTIPQASEVSQESGGKIVGITELLERAKLAGDADDRAPQTPQDTDDVVIPDDASALDDLLEPDPKPKKRGSSKIRIGGNPAAKSRVTVAQRKQVTEALELMQMMLGGALSFRDPHCGGAILKQAHEIAEKATPLICRNPAWVAWFTGSAGFLDVLGLIMAIQPVASAVWGHHVTGTIGREEGEHVSDYSQFTAPSL